MSYREMMVHFLGGECTSCGSTNLRDLKIHHIDKNRKNNKTSNLKVLCRKCHGIAHRKPRPPKKTKTQKPRRKIAVEILKHLVSGVVNTPKEIAMALDAPPQLVRNDLTHLRGLRLVKNEGYGRYSIDVLGRKHYFEVLHPLQDQTLRRTQ